MPSLLDLPYSTRLWREKCMPLYLNEYPHEECTYFRTKSVRLKAPVEDVWELRNYISEYFGATLNIKQDNDAWIIEFCSEQVAVAFHRWVSENLALFAKKSTWNKDFNESDYSITLSNEPQKRLAVFFADMVLIGNFINKRKLSDETISYEFQTMSNESSLGCYFAPKQFASGSLLNKISVVVDSESCELLIFFRPSFIQTKLDKLAWFCYSASTRRWFRFEIPFSSLVNGLLLLQEIPLENTVEYVDLVISINLFCAPRVFQQEDGDYSYQNSYLVDTFNPKLEWIRHWSTSLELPYNSMNTSKMSFSVLDSLGNERWQFSFVNFFQNSNVLILTRSRISCSAVSRLKAFLFRCSISSPNVRISITIKPPLPFEEEKNLQSTIFTALKKARPRYIIFYILLLFSHGAIPSFFSLLHTRCKCLYKREKYSDFVILQTLRMIFVDFRRPCWDYNFPALLQQCLERCLLFQSTKPENDTCSSVNFFLIVTPLRIYLMEDYELKDNRVVRTFRTRKIQFLRVAFREETLEPILFPKNDSVMMKRSALILELGLRIHTIHFEFLACSQSQLKTMACWFVHIPKKVQMTPTSLLEYFGDFSSIPITGKMVCRIGQCLSTVLTFIDIDESDCSVINDTVAACDSSQPFRKEFLFTDGIGYCSQYFLYLVAKNLNLVSVPSAVQIRYKGFKGLLTRNFLDSKINAQNEFLNLKKHTIVCTNSMQKFESPNTAIDVIGYSTYASFYFNRQILFVLDTLGLNWSVILGLLHEQIEIIRLSKHTISGALRFLGATKIDDNVSKLLRCILQHGIRIEESFVQNTLDLLAWRDSSDLIKRAAVACENGAVLLGIVDCSFTLKYEHGNGMPEVYIRIRKPDDSTSDFNSKKILEDICFTVLGPVLVTRCPVIYPGDCQLCYAVDVPYLSNYENVIVFPQQLPDKNLRPPPLQKNHPCWIAPNDSTYLFNAHNESFVGYRDIPNMLSGGDLDGDRYHILWEPRIVNHLLRLHRKNQMIKPAGFYVQTFSSDSTSNDMGRSIVERTKKFFLSFPLNDSLGRIATACIVRGHALHVYAGGKLLHPDSIRLAHLHNDAVDMMKTEKEVCLHRSLRHSAIPHFHNNNDYNYYYYYNNCHTNEKHDPFYSVSLLGFIYDQALYSRSSTYLSEPFIPSFHASLVRYENIETPSIVEAIRQSFYTIRVEWEIPLSILYSSIKNLKLFVFKSQHESLFHSWKLSNVLHCEPTSKFLELSIEHYGEKPLYVALHLLRSDFKSFPVNLPTPHKVLCLHSGSGTPIEPTPPFQQLQNSFYSFLFVYNAPYTYGNELLSWLKNGLLDFVSTFSFLNVTVTHTFHKLKNARNPAQLYEMSSPRNFKEHHYYIVVSASASFLEQLFQSLTSVPPTFLSYTREYLPSYPGIVPFSSSFDSLLSTHPLDESALGSINYIKERLCVEAVPQDSYFSPFSFYECFFHRLQELPDLGYPLYPILDVVSRSHSVWKAYIYFPSYVEKNHFKQHFFDVSNNMSWQFTCIDTIQTEFDQDPTLEEAVIFRNKTDCTNSRHSFFRQLAESFSRSSKTLTSLRCLFCFFVISKTFFRTCIQSIKNTSRPLCLDATYATLFHSIHICLSQSIDDFLRNKLCNSTSDHDEYITDILFDTASREKIWETYQLYKKQGWENNGPLHCASALVVTKSPRITAELMESCYTSSTFICNNFSITSDDLIPDCNEIFLSERKNQMSIILSRPIFFLPYNDEVICQIDSSMRHQEFIEHNPVLIPVPATLLLHNKNIFSQYSVLRTNIVDLDLVHGSFDVWVSAISPHIDDFILERENLLIQLNLSTESELLASCSILPHVICYGEDSSRKISSTLKSLISNFKLRLAPLMLLKTNDEREAISSAAYIINHQRRYDHLCSLKTPALNLNSQEHISNIFSSCGEKSRQPPPYTEAFCWIFFKSYLISLKQKALRKNSTS